MREFAGGLKAVHATEQESREVSVIEITGASGASTAQITLASDLISLSPTRETDYIEIK
jgi:hypothetical protein